MTSVLLALEEPFVRTGVQVIIDQSRQFQVAGYVESVEEVLSTVQRRRAGPRHRAPTPRLTPLGNT